MVITRTASAILVLASVSLFASRLVSPASSAPEPRVAPLDAVEQTPPAVAEVNAEIERLQGRTAVAPEAPSTARDPFSFGRATERTRPLVPTSEIARVVETPPAPVPPRLIAILSPADPSLPRTAVFAAGEDVEMRSAGDELGMFHVDAVNPDAIVLVDRETRDKLTVSLH